MASVLPTRAPRYTVSVQAFSAVSSRTSSDFSVTSCCASASPGPSSRRDTSVICRRSASAPPRSSTVEYVVISGTTASSTVRTKAASRYGFQSRPQRSRSTNSAESRVSATAARASSATHHPPRCHGPMVAVASACSSWTRCSASRRWVSPTDSRVSSDSASWSFCSGMRGWSR
ncbi:hypothetical protein SGRIM128S_02365 [Streptomyces griseomycini]